MPIAELRPQVSVAPAHWRRIGTFAVIEAEVAVTIIVCSPLEEVTCTARVNLASHLCAVFLVPLHNSALNNASQRLRCSGCGDHAIGWEIIWPFMRHCTLPDLKSRCGSSTLQESRCCNAQCALPSPP